MTDAARARAVADGLNAAFAHAVDRHELELLRSVLADDVVYVTGDTVLHGVDAVLGRFARRAAPRTTRHQPGPVHVLACDDTAIRTVSTWTCFAGHSAGPHVGPVHPYSVADFRDVVRRTPAGWRVAERRIEFVFRDPDLAPRD